MQKQNKEQIKMMPPTKAHEKSIFAFHFQRFQTWRKGDGNTDKK